jgi:protein tyrosine phosphatase
MKHVTSYLLHLSPSLQGPLPPTIVDFWRLVWQEGVPSIVMVTSIKEDGKIKCQQYWPESGHQKYGPFTVATTENKVFEVSVSFSGQLMFSILWDTVGYCGCGIL